jgi:citrate synthase
MRDGTAGRAEYLDAEAAARFLGVKPRTLYSYASRGLVRSEPRPGSRGRQYAREDLERLKSRHDARSGHGPVAASALRFGEPVLATAVSGIGKAGPLYRGVSAVGLAREGRSFEAVSELLWTGLLSGGALWTGDELRAAGSSRERGERSPRKVATLPLFLTVASRLALLREGEGEGGDVPSAAFELTRARRLIRTFAALAGPQRLARDAARRASVAEVLATALGARSRNAPRALDFALVVTADHELNASTFAARVIASTGAGLYPSVAGALAALTGPRHGGSTERVEALLDALGVPNGAHRGLRERAARGEAIPGFGHPLYPDGDPRASSLLDLASEVAGARALARCLAVARAMQQDGRDAPNLDFALVALRRALGLPRGSGAVLFAVARTAGWVAHAVEQRESGQLLRPRARYEGPHDTSPIHASATRSSGAGSR